MITAQLLRGFSVFKGLNDNQLNKIAELCKERSLKQGEHIFEEGTRAIDVHLCRSGKVDLMIWVREPWNRNVIVHQAEAGELFGWSALVVPFTYTATAECVEAGQVIYIRGSLLLDLFDEDNHMGYTVMRNIAGDVSVRLTQTRQKLSTEWLNAGMPSLVTSTAWGEPEKR
jgi:CRP/FNR family transcriptional regulator, cyclic AMP receptor protein